MGPMRPGLDLSTICSSEDDGVNNVGGAEATEDGERPEVRQAAQRGGVEPGPGPTGRGGDVGAQVEADGAENVRFVGRELALQAWPQRVGVGSRVELRPRRVAEEVRHHSEDGRQLHPRQLRRRRVPSGDSG
ncbi:hypothetical protein ZEAMMB73_Zm00001d022319 [Zea mays]|jgi:hypothetical protein|uniref:Uncharacterized protein n=1 Tax=Zea mays TaxID=4577 RepID=A0A1D6IL27_MAIZE|nr:hypothetical protein ZEAMMB73_Zm00001d022319 [Zea mays]